MSAIQRLRELLEAVIVEKSKPDTAVILPGNKASGMRSTRMYLRTAGVFRYVMYVDCPASVVEKVKRIDLSYSVGMLGRIGMAKIGKREYGFNMLRRSVVPEEGGVERAVRIEMHEKHSMNMIRGKGSLEF